MKFYRGNTLLRTDNNAPYNHTWSDVSTGTNVVFEGMVYSIDGILMEIYMVQKQYGQ